VLGWGEARTLAGGTPTGAATNEKPRPTGLSEVSLGGVADNGTAAQ